MDKCKECEMLAEKVARLEEQIKAMVAARGEMWARLDERFRGSDRRIDDRFEGSDKVRDEKAEALAKVFDEKWVANEAHFQRINGLQAQLDKQSTTFVTWPALYAGLVSILMLAIGIAAIIQRAIK